MPQQVGQRHGALEDPSESPINLFVTESKLLLLATRQANKLRDKVLGQGIRTLFAKPADREDSGLLSQRTVFPELQLRLLLY